MLLVFLGFIALLLVVLLLDTLRNGITPTPTSPKVRKRILQSLPNFKGQLADLGSGFGSFAFSAAQQLKTKQVVAFEKALLPYCISQLCRLVRRPRIQLYYQNFLTEDLSSYGLVFCYLYRGIMPKLWLKLKKEMKPGSWVISHTFAFPSVEIKKVIYADDLYHTPIYFYQI